MGKDIFKQNRPNLIESIIPFENELSCAKKMIEHEDYEELEEWMKKANTLHEIL